MDLPNCLKDIIAAYIGAYILLDWVDESKLDMEQLSKNPNAIHLLEQNLDKVDWGSLSYNPNAIHILEKNLDKVDWGHLSRNPSIFKLKKFPELN